MDREQAPAGQVSASTAQIYETFFVPGLMGPWAARVAEAANLATGQRVLDVACGTGALTREVARRVGPSGFVAGVDLNEGMLTVARSILPAVDWRLGKAEALPFVDHEFDAVVSQFGLMFFQDRVRALREMRRVLRPAGRVTLAVWASLDQSPAYATLSQLLRRRFGDAIGDENDAPFVLGDPSVLGGLFRQAGFDEASVVTMGGTAMFPSFDLWMHTEIKGWTLADKVNEEQYAQFVAEARPELRRYVEVDGAVRFPIAAHIVTASARPTP